MTKAQAGGIVSGAHGDGSTGLKFGTLDFGTRPATFTGALAATAPTSGTYTDVLQVTLAW